MSQAKCLIRITGLALRGESFSCTGAQLAQILTLMKMQTNDCVWFVADTDSYGQLPNALNVPTNSNPVLVGDTNTLTSVVQEVDQFLSGVFLAVPIVLVPPSWSRAFLSEDTPFRDADDSRFEIRAVDTSYFEIYSTSKESLRHLWEEFQVEPICI